MNHTLPAGKYSFKCELLSDAILPPYKGSTFRGAFGVALKKVVCAVREKDCSFCLLKERCIYARIFEAKAGTGGPHSRIAAPPHPYLIEPPLAATVNYAAGDEFNFNLLLFGEANDFLPYFVYAFESMGEQGIGKKMGEHRARFILKDVEMNGTAIYNAARRKLAPLKVENLTLCPVAPSGSAGRLTLTFQTPLRLKSDNRFAEELTFELLVRAMLRRISSLFSSYGNGEPALDYRGLVANARQVSSSEKDLNWIDWERYSARQDKMLMMGGIMGSITFQGVPAEYLPLFELCKTLHIGKQTSFGLGLYDFLWEEEA